MDTPGIECPVGAVPPQDNPAEPPCVEVAGHELTVFVEAEPLIEAMVADIRAARSRVWVETYIFMADDHGRAVAEALKDRARAGLDVRVLYDFIGSQTTPASFFRDLEEAGVRVHCFHSLGEALRRFAFFRVLNRRNHRKTTVIDDDVAYFGGMNIVDQTDPEYGGQPASLPSSAGWRDVHVRLTGPQQAEVADSFERSWRRARGEPVQRRPRAYRQALLAPGPESIQIFDSGPGLKHTRAARIFIRLIRGAKRSITISMAYFLPVGRVLGHLLRAHRRRVYIQVVVPGENDVRLVQRASRAMYDKLLRRRIHLYEREHNMLHSKVMVVDDAWVVVGSCNLDARSLWINYEFLAVIHSRAFARAINGVVRYEIEHSRRITFKECYERRWGQRLLDKVAWALRWWL